MLSTHKKGNCVRDGNSNKSNCGNYCDTHIINHLKLINYKPKITQVKILKMESESYLKELEFHALPTRGPG